jgi:hypothetical protein
MNVKAPSASDRRGCFFYFYNFSTHFLQMFLGFLTAGKPRMTFVNSSVSPPQTPPLPSRLQSGGGKYQEKE